MVLLLALLLLLLVSYLRTEVGTMEYLTLNDS